MASSQAPLGWRVGVAGLWSHGERWLKLADLGRKLGIPRHGIKSGRNNSYQDVPPEMFMEEGYDAKKDLVHKGKVQAATRALMGGGGRLKVAPRPPPHGLSGG
jgi:hypothetical protein